MSKCSTELVTPASLINSAFFQAIISQKIIAIMRKINGKLIIQEIHQPDDIKTQIMNFNQQQNQKYNQELNNIQSQLSNLDKKCIILEDTIIQQFTRLLIINICSVIGLIFLCFWFNHNSQGTNIHNIQPTTKPKLQQLHK